MCRNKLGDKISKSASKKTNSCPFWEFNISIKYNNCGQKNDIQFNNCNICAYNFDFIPSSLLYLSHARIDYGRSVAKK